MVSWLFVFIKDNLKWKEKHGMNRILDKLGLYDLIAVLLSGVSISTFSILILQNVYKVTIDISLQANETFNYFFLATRYI